MISLQRAFPTSQLCLPGRATHVQGNSGGSAGGPCAPARDCDMLPVDRLMIPQLCCSGARKGVRRRSKATDLPSWHRPGRSGGLWPDELALPRGCETMAIWAGMEIATVR